MKNLFMVAAAVFLLAFGSAQAQQDNSRFYVTGSVGGYTASESRIDAGLAAGYQIIPYARVELTYDHAWMTNNSGNMVMANVIGQYRIPGTIFTPYVLAGAGAGFDGFGQKYSGAGVGLYNVGSGVRASVGSNVDLDLRYRWIGAFNSSETYKSGTNMFTLGASYNF